MSLRVRNMEEKRVRCFCLALDDREERLRDLILLRRLPALSLSRFLYSCVVFFLFSTYIIYIYICVIALVYYYSTSLAVTAVFVLLFFLLRKLKTNTRSVDVFFLFSLSLLLVKKNRTKTRISPIIITSFSLFLSSLLENQRSVSGTRCVFFCRIELCNFFPLPMPFLSSCLYA